MRPLPCRRRSLAVFQSRPATPFCLPYSLPFPGHCTNSESRSSQSCQANRAKLRYSHLPEACMEFVMTGTTSEARSPSVPMNRMSSKCSPSTIVSSSVRTTSSSANPAAISAIAAASPDPWVLNLEAATDCRRSRAGVFFEPRQQPQSSSNRVERGGLPLQFGHNFIHDCIDPKFSYIGGRLLERHFEWLSTRFRFAVSEPRPIPPKREYAPPHQLPCRRTPIHKISMRSENNSVRSTTPIHPSVPVRILRRIFPTSLFSR